MAAINTIKVITGGLVAGVIVTAGDFLLNGLVLAADNEAMAQARNIDLATLETGSTLAMIVLGDLLFGIVAVWTYAAIRPRFGPGPGTATRAGLIVYVAAGLTAFGFTAMGLFPVGLFLKSAAAYLVILVAATVAGAALYTEA